MADAERANLRLGAAVVACRLAVAAPRRNLPGLPGGPETAEGALDRRIGRAAFRVSSHSRGIGELRDRLDRPAGYAVRAHRFLGLLAISRAPRRTRLLLRVDCGSVARDALERN